MFENVLTIFWIIFIGFDIIATYVNRIFCMKSKVWSILSIVSGSVLCISFIAWSLVAIFLKFQHIWLFLISAVIYVLIFVSRILVFISTRKDYKSKIYTKLTS